MSPIPDIGARLRDAWRAIMDAEQARGAAQAHGDDSAQATYEAALVLFRHAQIEAFTVLLGAIPLLQEQVDDLMARVAALEAQP